MKRLIRLARFLLSSERSSGDKSTGNPKCHFVTVELIRHSIALSVKVYWKHDDNVTMISLDDDFDVSHISPIAATVREIWDRIPKYFNFLLQVVYSAVVDVDWLICREKNEMRNRIFSGCEGIIVKLSVHSRRRMSTSHSSNGEKKKMLWTADMSTSLKHETSFDRNSERQSGWSV